jgi:hypothetical protein
MSFGLMTFILTRGLQMDIVMLRAISQNVILMKGIALETELGLIQLVLEVEILLVVDPCMVEGLLQSIAQRDVLIHGSVTGFVIVLVRMLIVVLTAVTVVMILLKSSFRLMHLFL